MRDKRGKWKEEKDIKVRRVLELYTCTYIISKHGNSKTETAA